MLGDVMTQTNLSAEMQWRQWLRRLRLIRGCHLARDEYRFAWRAFMARQTPKEYADEAHGKVTS